MDFSFVFFDLKNKGKIFRKAWEKGEFIYINKPSQKIYIHKNNKNKNSLWAITQEDILADDWECFELTRGK